MTLAQSSEGTAVALNHKRANGFNLVFSYTLCFFLFRKREENHAENLIKLDSLQMLQNENCVAEPQIPFGSKTISHKLPTSTPETQ